MLLGSGLWAASFRSILAPSQLAAMSTFQEGIQLPTALFAAAAAPRALERFTMRRPQVSFGLPFASISASSSSATQAGKIVLQVKHYMFARWACALPQAGHRGHACERFCAPMRVSAGTLLMAISCFYEANRRWRLPSSLHGRPAIAHGFRWCTRRCMKRRPHCQSQLHSMPSVLEC